MKRRFATITILIALVLALAACGTPNPTETAGDTVTFTDDLGREVTSPAGPQRVAALIGSFADVWCLAGGRDTLVATADDAWTSFDLGLD